jgi:ribosomal protein S18 acetylase RimI-like enzyme
VTGDFSGPIRRRPATGDDEEFLRNLIVATVAEELQAWAWPEGMRAQLLDMQYRVRRTGVEQNYPEAERSIILAGDLPVGWLVVHKTAAEIHVVDIAVMPERRGSGIGTIVLEELLAESDRNGIPVRLSVNVTNPAARLYERLGFRRTGGNEVQHFMERKPRGAT